MIRGGPVETYLKELQKQLPYPAPRLLAETREHLMETASARVIEGHSEPEAERLAIAGYGPISDVVAAVRTEGSALMSPRVLRWIAPVAVLLSLPTAIFMFVNAIEHLAGSDGSEGVFGTALDAWGTTLNTWVAVGPLLALSLIAFSSVRIHRERGVGGLQATIELKMTRATVVTGVLIGAAAVAVLGHGIVQTYTTWSDFVGQNWTCTIENGQQVCYQGNSLLEP